MIQRGWTWQEPQDIAAHWLRENPPMQGDDYQEYVILDAAYYDTLQAFRVAAEARLQAWTRETYDDLVDSLQRLRAQEGEGNATTPLS